MIFSMNFQGIKKITFKVRTTGEFKTSIYICYYDILFFLHSHRDTSSLEFPVHLSVIISLSQGKDSGVSTIFKSTVFFLILNYRLHFIIENVSLSCPYSKVENIISNLYQFALLYKLVYSLGLSCFPCLPTSNFNFLLSLYLIKTLQYPNSSVQ